MVAFLTFLAVALLVALLRALPRLIHDANLRHAAFPLAGDQGDAMSHLVMIDLARRHRGGPPRTTEQFLLGKRLDYPMFFHWLVSFLPAAVVERFDWVVSPLIEGVHAFAMCLFAAWFLGLLGETDAVAWAAAAVLAAAMTPILARGWRRAGFIGERSFGFLFGNCYLMAVVVLLVQPSWHLLLAAVVLFAIAAASSKFALQAMAFISLVIAALLLDWRPLAVLAIAFVGAVALSRGYVWWLLQGHIRHSALYRSRLVHISDATTAFSGRDLWNALAAAARGEVRAAHRSLVRHPIGRLPLQLPWIVPFALVLALLAARHAGMPEPLTPVVAFGAAAMLVGILTAADPLKFLGEGERYFEYAALPLVLTVFAIPPGSGGSWWLGLAAVGVWRYARELLRPALFRGPEPAAAELAATMRLLPPGLVLAIPGRLALPLCYRTAHKAIWNIAHIEPGEATRQWLGLFPPGSHYPFPHPSVVSEVIARFRPDYLVVWQSGIAATEAHRGFRYDLAGYARLFGNQHYAILDARVGVGAVTSRLAAAQ